MSEKNGQAAQWQSKGVAATTATQSQQQQIQQGLPIYNPNALGLTAANLYGGTSHLSTGSSHQHDAVSYVSARFQAPPLDHHQIASSTTMHSTQSQPSTSNVPAPSGFIPPPFSPASAAALSVTSVLTPNPYAVATLTGQNASATSTSHSHAPAALSSQPFPGPHPIPTTPHHIHSQFGMDQLQHLNVQQQYELRKLMAASYNSNQMGSAVPTNLTSSAAVCTASTANATQTIVTASQQPLSGIRQPHSQSLAANVEVPNANAGAINSQLADQVINTISTGSSGSKLATTPIHGRLMGLGIQAADEEKLSRIQHVVESGIGEQAKEQIVQILDRISTLRPVEKLLLYLRLPGEHPETDPLRQPQNPLGTRSEINHTINWVRTHLEQDPQVSIPKQDVYNDYIIYCDRLKIKPLSTADFGKVMKQVFPGIRPRRLGTRGHSRYCYAAMRKTSKLPAPHLPTLNTTLTTIKGEADEGNETTNAIIDSIDDQEESWSVIKQWAENILHIKVNDVKDLATQIKTSGPLSGLASQTHAPYTGGTPKSSNVPHKKYAQREPKEKRALADIGPLKKRRKKKRKGSSSSESSSHQLSAVGSVEQQHLQAQSQLSPANSSKSSHHNVLSPATYVDDGQNSMNMIKIKQEIIDSPSYPTSVASAQQTQSIDIKNVPTYHVPQQQQQMMPINLAAETRGGNSSRANSTITTSAFEHLRQPLAITTNNTIAAVKNLTPKIMELSVENPMVSSSPPPSQTVIKQEVGIDDYNTSNIFCKKVRKAQQTKGFWANSPNSNRTSSSTTSCLPIITTTASTPPPESNSGQTPSTSTSIDSGAAITTSYAMGPPAQMAPSTSPNNQSHQEDALNQAKVYSRNHQQLRAKKLLTANAANCDPPDLSAVKDAAADLPENLGLPRERVISICNMDKHELDDYFLPVEEENSEDQETELLQYFQMGDAEEKLIKNSSSDAKRHSYPTAPVQMLSNALTSTTTTTASMMMSSSGTSASRMMLTMANASKHRDSLHHHNNEPYNGKQNRQLSQQALNYLKSTYANTNQSKVSSGSLTSSLSSAKSITTAVGTASASLEQILQKHQHHQLQQRQQQTMKTDLQEPQQPQPPSKVSNKRKINLNTSSATSDITAARKNYSFLPISPNINTTSSAINTTSSTSGGAFFASPGFSRLLTKQQSLDCESSSDPMIGATRKRRSYMSAMTSASAPPSPSVLKQQQEQQLFALSHNMLMDQWSSSNSTYNNSTTTNQTSNALLVDQNSLDLDLFGEAAAAATAASVASSTTTSGAFNIRNSNCITLSGNNDGITANSESAFNELTQRSRSVPLSQLQRSLSPSFNRTFHMGPTNPNAYSACNSLAQTPVPSEFIDSVTMLSENSCSQQSASLKLEEVGNVVGSDSTALLDEVDVSEILSSPDFVTKFSSITHAGGTSTKASCSSAGSSSGYSSAGHFSLSLSSYSSNGSAVGGNGAVASVMSSSISRSVPSTPLPHHNPTSVLGNGNSFYRKRFANNCQSLNSGAFVSSFSTTGKYDYGNMNSSLSRSACDISKSMPSTPITTTPSNFRYSPSEFTRDFLINGNTIDDSITSSFGAVGGNDNLMGSDVVGVDGHLHADSLLNEEDSLVNGPGVSITSDYGAQSNASVLVETGVGMCSTGSAGGESSIVIGGVGPDILDSL